MREAVVQCVQCECERAAYSLCGLGALLRVASVGRAPAGSSERAEALTRPSEDDIPALDARDCEGCCCYFCSFCSRHLLAVMIWYIEVRQGKKHDNQTGGKKAFSHSRHFDLLQ